MEALNQYNQDKVLEDELPLKDDFEEEDLDLFQYLIPLNLEMVIR